MLAALLWVMNGALAWETTGEKEGVQAAPDSVAGTNGQRVMAVCVGSAVRTMNVQPW